MEETQTMKIYDITADYRKNNLRKPHYYVIANTAKEAKEKFHSLMSWLDIYSCELVEDNALIQDLLNKQHILIR